MATEPTSRRRHHAAILGGALALAAALAALGFAEPPPDTWYYVTWAREPALAYLDHPGAVAWPFMLVPEPWRPLAATLLPLLAGALHIGILSSWLDAHDAPLPATLALAAAPLLLGGALIWTPDVPLIIAWHGGLTVLATRRRPWLLVLCAAVMAASKITGLWLAFTWLVVARGDARLRRPALVGVLVAGGVFVATGLPSAAFQLTRAGNSATGLLHAAGSGVSLLVGQLAIIGPFLGVAVLIAAWRGRCSAPDDASSIGMHLGIAVLAALPFVVVAPVVPVEPNWLAPMWLPLFAVAIAVRRHRSWRAVAGGQCVVLVALVVQLVAHPLGPAGDDPLFSRLRGWRAWAERFPDAPLVIADRYQRGAPIAAQKHAAWATFDALGPRLAVREAALDDRTSLAHHRVLVVWAERRPPEAELAARWPAMCLAGVVVGAPDTSAPHVTQWMLRASSVDACPTR